MMDPEALRVAADAYMVKSDRLWDQGREGEAMVAFDMAISLRLKANAIEDSRSIGIGASILKG